MKNTIAVIIACLLIGLVSIVPWAESQQKPTAVLIWCQDVAGNSAPCLAGNSLDYDTGAGTVMQGTIGFVVPGSGGPVAAGTATTPLRIDPTGTTPQPVTDTGVGTPGDASVTVGSTGSLSAKMRLQTTQLDNILTELGQKTEPANTQMVAGTVTANAGTGTFNIQANASINQSQIGGVALQPAANGLNTTGAGLPASAMTGQCDNASIVALTENSFGHLRVNCTTHQQIVEVGTALPAGTNTIGNVNPGTPTNWAVHAEESTESAGENLSVIGTVRRDTAASSATATGRHATINTDASGLLWTRNLDPCTALPKTYIPINVSTATTTELTASLAGASNHYYVCSINIGPVAAAQNAALVDDDTDNCASVTSGLAGGTTAGSGWNISANGGLVLGNGQSSVARTNGTNRVLCLVTSAAVQTSGVLTVVAAP